jgi:zinc protease
MTTMKLGSLEGVAPRLPRPTPHAPRPYHFPPFERRSLSNGVRLVVAPVRKAPLVSVVLVFEAGATADPAGRAGVAQLVARLLLEGTGAIDGAELAVRFERLGASVDAHADWDVAVVSLTALAERFDEAFALLGEVLRAPAFPAREVERLKAERIADIMQLRTEPRGLADEAFDRFLYAGSRYASPAGGSEAEVRAIGRDDVVAFYGQRYSPGGLTIVAAGDTDADAMAALAERVIGGWRGDPVHYLPAGDRAARDRRAVHVVAKPDAPQSELRIGHVGIPRGHPDYFAAVVMNAILGGLFSSRINLNLREAHGYTYGAFSGFEWRRQAGPWAVSSAVKSQVTAEAVREVLGEIDRIRSAPVAPEELSLATSYLDGVFPIRYETTESIAAALANLVVYDLPDDWFDAYRDRVRAVSGDAVLAAARAHLHPDAIQVVAVGDPEQIRGPLAALGVGEVEVYDPEGKRL